MALCLRRQALQEEEKSRPAKIHTLNDNRCSVAQSIIDITSDNFVSIRGILSSFKPVSLFQ